MVGQRGAIYPLTRSIMPSLILRSISSVPAMIFSDDTKLVMAPWRGWLVPPLTARRASSPAVLTVSAARFLSSCLVSLDGSSGATGLGGVGLVGGIDSMPSSRSAGVRRGTCRAAKPTALPSPLERTASTVCYDARLRGLLPPFRATPTCWVVSRSEERGQSEL